MGNLEESPREIEPVSESGLPIKVPQRVRELGIEPKLYVDDMARQFQDVWRALDI
jgi:hypothetical protein